MLTTLSGDEVVQLREELDLIKDSFSLVEFDEEDMDEKKGTVPGNININTNPQRGTRHREHQQGWKHRE